MSVGGLDKGVLSTLCEALGMFTFGAEGRLYSEDEHGVKSIRDTVDSRPSGYHLCTYAECTKVNSTSSTSE